MILVAITPALGIISRYARDTHGITRLTYAAQAIKEEQPFTFENSAIVQMRYSPPAEYAVPGIDGVGERIGVRD